jgi:hypothetical protein
VTSVLCTGVRAAGFADAPTVAGPSGAHGAGHGRAAPPERREALTRAYAPAQSQAGASALSGDSRQHLGREVADSSRTSGAALVAIGGPVFAAIGVGALADMDTDT